MALGAPIFALAVASLRVRSGHHTVAQVAVGAVLGALFALGYFYGLFPMVTGVTARIFSAVGETGTLVLLLSIAALAVVALGPLNERWKEMYRRPGEGGAPQLGRKGRGAR